MRSRRTRKQGGRQTDRQAAKERGCRREKVGRQPVGLGMESGKGLHGVETRQVYKARDQASAARGNRWEPGWEATREERSCVGRPGILEAGNGTDANRVSALTHCVADCFTQV